MNISSILLENFNDTKTMNQFDYYKSVFKSILSMPPPSRFLITHRTALTGINLQFLFFMP